MDLIGQKLNLKPGDTLLDIGCGWGGFAEFVGKNYDIKMAHVCQLKQYMVRISLGVSLKLSIYYEISMRRGIIRKLV